MQNAERMLRAQKLSGMTLAINYYADYSEVRFRKLLMTNNDYSSLIINDFEAIPPSEPYIPSDVSWSQFVPPSVHVDPFIKCASSWAVAVTSYMYMKYKELDPLWKVHSSKFILSVGTFFCTAASRLRC